MAAVMSNSGCQRIGLYKTEKRRSCASSREHVILMRARDKLVIGSVDDKSMNMRRGSLRRFEAVRQRTSTSEPSTISPPSTPIPTPAALRRSKLRFKQSGSVSYIKSLLSESDNQQGQYQWERLHINELIELDNADIALVKHDCHYCNYHQYNFNALT